MSPQDAGNRNASAPDRVREAASRLLAAVQSEQEWGTNCDPDNFGCGCEGTVTSGPMADEDRPCSSCRAKITKARALALRSALAAPPAATGSVDEADRLDALRAQRAVVTRNYARDPSNENEAALYAICERVYAAERRVAASTGSGAAPTRDAVAEVLLHEAHPDLAPWSLLQLSGHNAAGIVAAVALARRQADAVMARWSAPPAPRGEAVDDGTCIDGHPHRCGRCDRDIIERSAP